MNITPVSYRANNSANQSINQSAKFKTQNTPNFKGTIVAKLTEEGFENVDFRGLLLFLNAKINEKLGSNIKRTGLKWRGFRIFAGVDEAFDNEAKGTVDALTADFTQDNSCPRYINFEFDPRTAEEIDSSYSIGSSLHEAATLIIRGTI